MMTETLGMRLVESHYRPDYVIEIVVRQLRVQRKSDKFLGQPFGTDEWVVARKQRKAMVWLVVESGLNSAFVEPRGKLVTAPIQNANHEDVRNDIVPVKLQQCQPVQRP